MTRSLSLAALLAGVAIVSTGALTSGAEARPLPVSVERLAGESDVTTVARRGRVVRTGRSVRTVRTVRRAPVRTVYRYRRAPVLATGLAVGAVGALAAGAIAGNYYGGYDPYYGGYYPAASPYGYGGYYPSYPSYSYGVSYGYPSYYGGSYYPAPVAAGYYGRTRYNYGYRPYARSDYGYRNDYGYGRRGAIAVQSRGAYYPRAGYRGAYRGEAPHGRNVTYGGGFRSADFGGYR